MDEERWLFLNVGGKIFATTRTTLCAKDPNSVLAKMFDTNIAANPGSSVNFKWKNQTDSTGAYLIDRSPIYFEPILNYLRTDQLIVDRNLNLLGVLEEAKFFCLSALVSLLEERIALEKQNEIDDHSPITRSQIVRILLNTPYSLNNHLRFQGVNFSGADLSYLDLRNVNFKHANLKGANLQGANLSHCNFERANLSATNLDGAQLLAARMNCACLDDASLKGCNFEDPQQIIAILEGASLKRANLEGSQMRGVNLRVACLKNAVLRNCDLTGAVLAGANLENCDLSGSDLQEANLRGANFNGTTFELMPTALHMSQAVN